MQTIKSTLFALLLTALFLQGTAGQAQICTGSSCEPKFKNMRDAIDTILAREQKHDWQKIQWRTNASAALEEARGQDKPVFVFFVVKQRAPSPKNWVGDANDMGKT